MASILDSLRQLESDAAAERERDLQNLYTAYRETVWAEAQGLSADVDVEFFYSMLPAIDKTVDDFAADIAAITAFVADEAACLGLPEVRERLAFLRNQGGDAYTINRCDAELRALTGAYERVQMFPFAHPHLFPRP